MLIRGKRKLTQIVLYLTDPNRKLYLNKIITYTHPPIPTLSLKGIILNRPPDALAHMVNDCYHFHWNPTEWRIETGLYNGLYLSWRVEIDHPCCCVCYQRSVSLCRGQAFTSFFMLLYVHRSHIIMSLRSDPQRPKRPPATTRTTMLRRWGPRQCEANLCTT